jgi:dolichyl-phosphate mannosyltransferase polypeptide 2 regulatory subunit
MLVAASVVFLYYSIWTLAMVSPQPLLCPFWSRPLSTCDTPSIELLFLTFRFYQPFVDSDHPLQNVFPPRVWAIRIPVILILLGSAVVGSFLGVVMIRSNRKKAAKAKAAASKKKA